MLSKLDRILVTIASLSVPVLSAAVQKPGLTVPPTYQGQLAAVKDIFNVSYAAYREFAWGHDDLAPLTRSFRDSRNGWGASIIDAASTAFLMGFDDYFAEAVNFSGTIDFSRSKTSGTVSVFETTIRYLGGLLSAYELSGEQHPVLLEKAVQVADKMAFAWVGNNDIPYGHIDFATNRPTVGNSNIAEAGTLLLEFETLSKYTGNATYTALAEKALRRIGTNATPLPGLAAQGINPTTGNPVGAYVTWGGGSDSYFEYLIKHARLTNTNDDYFADTWATAVDSSLRTLLKTSTVGGHVYLAEYDDQRRIRFISSHLACFHGGNFLYGGKLLNNDTIVNVGLQLTEACWNTYAGTATGIGPESFGFISPEGSFNGGSTPTSAQTAFHSQHGFYIRNSNYILRPEVLESNFYAWRVTGDTKYLDRAAQAVESFNRYLRATVGYAPITNVDNVNSSKSNAMESFWFAEVLKYLYLTFDDPKKVSVDDYVFNTEAHPFKAPPAKASYGSGKLRKSTGTFRLVEGLLPRVSALPVLGDLL